VTPKESAEADVWSLLTKNFRWDQSLQLSIAVSTEDTEVSPALQIFEVIVAEVFSSLRPDYEWSVTPNRPDGGLDFLGRQGFLTDETLGINASITVGGQCKKRTRVDDVVSELAGSLARMASSVNPTFFVVAFSARIVRERIEEARRVLEAVHQRHCHILDRQQIEGLLVENFAVVRPILRHALSEGEAKAVEDYFDRKSRKERGQIMAFLDAPTRALAGVPFRVTVSASCTDLARSGLLARWQSPVGTAEVDLLGPPGVEHASGLAVTGGTIDDPLDRRLSLEFVSYAVGEVALGRIVLSSFASSGQEVTEVVDLGSVQTTSNVRPRFYEGPFQKLMNSLEQHFERARTTGCESVAVVGHGGVGKSRVCEEFGLAVRRDGHNFVTARQSKTFNDPQRLMSSLLMGLVPGAKGSDDPASRILDFLGQFDPELSQRASAGVRSVVGSPSPVVGDIDEQDVLSALVVLIVAATRSGSLVLHLQDLHWCPPEILQMVERLTWQVSLVMAERTLIRDSERCVLFVLEGRFNELLDTGPASTGAFEAIIEQLGCSVSACDAMSNADGQRFTYQLFEDTHASDRRVSNEALPAQRDLVERINRSAGGNPFHTVEQVRLLHQSGALAQHPRTGQFYLVRPDRVGLELPGSIHDSIALRWRYLKKHSPDLATLMWATAMLDDRVPMDLFLHLRRQLAPDTSLRDVDGTEMVSTDDGRAVDATFRHEHYFHALRAFDLSADERERVVDAYCSFYEPLATMDTSDRFRWARALLERPHPNVTLAEALMQTALESTKHGASSALARRIRSNLLDLQWQRGYHATSTPVFLGVCDREVTLCRTLLGSDRATALARVAKLVDRIETRIRLADEDDLDALTLRRTTADVLRAQLYCNDGQLGAAARICEAGIATVTNLRQGGRVDDASLATLEMENRYALGLAYAILGDLDQALAQLHAASDLALVSSESFSFNVTSTYGCALLAVDQVASELLQRDVLARMAERNSPRSLQHLVEIHLAGNLISLATKDEPNGVDGRLAEAENLLGSAFAYNFRRGRYPDAGAAALTRGILSAVRGEDDEASWFAHAVSCAGRGRQMETLWRSHINLAMALAKSAPEVPGAAAEQARSAFEIMSDTLAEFDKPEGSLRFLLLRVPLAHAIRLMLRAGDRNASIAFERYPSMRDEFSDELRAELRPDLRRDDRFPSIGVGIYDYVLY
jgi:hypothetical protein